MSMEEFDFEKARQEAAKKQQQDQEAFARAKELFVAAVDRLTEDEKIRADARTLDSGLTNPEYEARLFVSKMTGSFEEQKDELTKDKPKPPERR